MHWIQTFIAGRMADSAFNRVAPVENEPAFGEPLVGFAAGTDPLWAFYKQDIGDFFWSPAEALALAYPGQDFDDSEVNVVSWVLPQTKTTRTAHRKAKDLPSMNWSKVRLYGERINEALRAAVVEELTRHGLAACAPVLLPQWSRTESAKYGFASRWSERHVAHAAGLGTFGLSDGLITPRGKAMRVGSAVVRTPLPVQPRPYTKHNEWCLFAAKGKCNACAKRCPVGAITERGHDKQKCKAYIRGTTAPYVEREQLGQFVTSCGLCQVGVPCEAGIPPALRKNS